MDGRKRRDIIHHQRSAVLDASYCKDAGMLRLNFPSIKITENAIILVQQGEGLRVTDNTSLPAGYLVSRISSLHPTQLSKLIFH